MVGCVPYSRGGAWKDMYRAGLATRNSGLGSRLPASRGRQQSCLPSRCNNPAWRLRSWIVPGGAGYGVVKTRGQGDHLATLDHRAPLPQDAVHYSERPWRGTGYRIDHARSAPVRPLRQVRAGICGTPAKQRKARNPRVQFGREQQAGKADRFRPASQSCHRTGRSA